MTHPFMPLAEHAIRHITVVLAADQRLIAASLMGSALSARFRPDSDVDVALLPKHGPRPLRRVAETRWQDLVQFCREIQIKIQP